MRLTLYTIAFLLAATLYCSVRLRAQDSLVDKRALNAIPVSKEPRHHIVFENKWIRVLDVRIPPGDTSLFHKHETPSVFIVLSDTKTGSEAIIEPGKPQLTYGNIWFEGFYNKPRIHRVWNSDSSEFHVMDIELLNRENRKTDTAIKNRNTNSSTLLFDEKPVRGYRQVFRPHTGIRLKETETPILVVNLGETTGKLTVNGKLFTRKGDYIFIPVGSPYEISNGQDRAAELAVFDLK